MEALRGAHRKPLSPVPSDPDLRNVVRRAAQLEPA